MKRNEKGQVLVLVALAIFGLLGLAALGIDVGYMYTVRHELQRCADSGALAGASAIRDRGTDTTDPITGTLARDRATDFAMRDEVSKSRLDPLKGDVVLVSFPTAMRVRVDVQRTVPLFFARILGRPTQAIPAFAVAEAFPVSDNVGCVVPWGIPVPWVDGSNGGVINGIYDNNETIHWDENGKTGAPTKDECGTLGAPTEWDIVTHKVVSGTQSERDQYLCQGSLQVLKIGDPNSKLNPGNFFGMDLSGFTESCPEGAPAINSGAAFYYYMIENSCACKMSVGVNNELPIDTKPGNMVQNTITAVAPTNYYIDPDGPGAKNPQTSYLPEAWIHDPAVPGSLMNRDPSSAWITADPWDEIPGGVPIGAFDPWDSSPRIVRVPVYHPDSNYKNGVYTPSAGKSTFKPLAYVGFWIQDIVYDPADLGSVVGRFVTVGGTGKGNDTGDIGGTPVLNIRLVE